MTGPDMIRQIEKLMDKYGMAIEFFVHGPEGLIAQSGFGPEMNWCVGKIELQKLPDAPSPEPEIIQAVFLYGLPMELAGGPLQYPIKTHDIPIKTERQVPL